MTDAKEEHPPRQRCRPDEKAEMENNRVREGDKECR
jgi:hypothetical protein